jgi:hypothetical protein
MKRRVDMSNFRWLSSSLMLTFFILVLQIPVWQPETQCSPATYVGSEGCKECHEKAYSSFMESPKAHSFESIARAAKGLEKAELNQCFECHTTGYGKEGGFKSEQETPQLKEAGCEVCHGPGGLHCETGDPKDIKGKLTSNDCDSCHNADRINSFKRRPMVHGGTHS